MQPSVSHSLPEVRAAEAPLLGEVARRAGVGAVPSLEGWRGAPGWVCLLDRINRMAHESLLATVLRAPQSRISPVILCCSEP